MKRIAPTQGFKKKSLSLKISLILASSIATLSGCSSSDDSGGNSLVCLDANANAQCDSGEESKSIATWEDAAVSTSLSDSSIPLAYKGEDGRTLTAPAGSSSVSPATTMLASEIFYNQLIDSKDTDSAKTYLVGVFGAELSAAQEADYSDAIETAIAANPTENRHAVIAAVTEKAIVSGLDGLKDIAVNAEDVAQASYPSLEELALAETLSLDVEDKIEEQSANGWIDAGDASIRVLSAANGKIIGGSHYHNALTVIDVDANTVVFTSVNVLSDAGHSVDSESGPSENYLRDVVFNADATAAYVNIAPKSLSSTNFHEAGYGLYKVAIESDDSIKTTTSGTSTVIDESVSTRVAVKISSFVVSGDGSKVITYNESDSLMSAYDADLNPIGSAVEIADVEAYAASAESVYIVQANAEDATKADITKLAADTLTGSETFTLDFVPAEMRLNEDGTKLLAFNHGHDHNSIMTIAVVQLSDLSVEQGTAKVTSDTAAISPDFTMLAAVGHEDDRVVIVNLSVPGFSVQSAHQLDFNARDVAFLNNEQIALPNEANSLAVLDISKTGKNINLEAKSALALENLNYSTINGGGLFSAVISDVALSSSYENVAITWSETGLTGSLDATNGAVTRPTMESVDVSGTLTANTSASFRGETVEDSKDFALTVRKEPALLPEPVAVQTADNSSQYMASNNDGDIMIAPVRFENADEVNVYGFIGVKVNNGQPSISTGTAELPKTYRDTESLVGVGITGSYAIGVSAALGDTGQARIFTASLNGNGVMNDSETSSVDITSGEPLKVGFNPDQDLAAVMIQKEDESFITEIYAIDGSGSLSLVNTIVNAAAEYKTYGPPAITDDASMTYQRDGESVVMTSADGQTTASAVVIEIARVWYYKGVVFVNTYEGNIVTFNENLDESSRKIFSTGTGGRMYGAAGRTLNGTDYLYIPVRSSADENVNGIYQLEILSDGSLKEIAFSKDVGGPNRMTVSGDGDTVFYSHSDDDGQWLSVVSIP